MAVQSIERVFTSLYTIRQHLVEIDFAESFRHTCLQKSTILQLVLALVAKLAVKRLPNICDLTIRSSLSAFAITTCSFCPQKLIEIAHPYSQQHLDTCEQIQKLLKYKKCLCLIYGIGPMPPITDMILAE